MTVTVRRDITVGRQGAVALTVPVGPDHVGFTDAATAVKTSGSKRPTGPGTVRYEDVQTGSMTQQQVWDAAANLTPNVPITLTYPPGTFTFSNFAANSTYGLRAKQNLSIAGSGCDNDANCTIFQMVPNTTTFTDPTSGTNQLYLLGVQNDVASTDIPYTGHWQNFALIGTPQNGQHYNGIKFTRTIGWTASDIYIEGIPGYAAAPPGETFHFNAYLGSGVQVYRLECDGRTTRYNGGTTSISASLLASNTHNNGYAEDCYLHHSPIGMPTLYDSAGWVTRRTRSIGNNCGFNHERVLSATHYDITVDLPVDKPHHFKMMNDLYDGQLYLYNPTWSGGQYSPRLVVHEGFRGGTMPDLQVSPPLVYYADGSPIPIPPLLVSGN